MNKNIRILTWFNFFCDFRPYAPIAILYFTHVTGSFALGMSIFSIIMIASALFEVPTGIFSDRIGRKMTVILGAVSSVLYSVIYALSGSYMLLAIGAILEGLARSFYSGNNDALLHDTLQESNMEHTYAHYLGRLSAMFQVALALSAITGGFLASWSYTWVMWISVVPQVVCLGLSFTIIEPKNTRKQESGNMYMHLKDAIMQFIHKPKLRLLSLSSIVSDGVGEAGYQFQAAFYGALIPVWAIGIVKALSNTGGFISFYYSGALIKKFGAKRILFTEIIYNRCINIISTVFPSPLSPLLTSTTSFFYGASTVATNSMLQKEFTNEQRATMGSLNSFAGSLAFALTGIILGYIADATSPITAYLVLNIFQFINFRIYSELFKHF